jgi:hypothetical protein
MFGALGCGGKAEDDGRPPPPLFSAPRATTTSPPAPQRPQPEPRTQPTPPSAPPRPPPQPNPDYTSYTFQGQVENVLSANCGRCHGSALTRDQAEAGINFIDDIAQLVEAGLIVPLRSATSRIVVVMRDGSMPPPETGRIAVSEDDIETVVSFIDDPLFWPDSPPPAMVDTELDIPPVDAGADGG